MTIALIVLCAVVLLGAYVALKGAQDAMERNSRRGDWAIFVVRWLIGSHWTGRPMTNAGFRRKGRGKALTQTGYAPPFYYRPRWQRILIRWAKTFGPPAALSCFLAWRTPTEVTLGLAAASLAAWGSWKLYRNTRGLWHRRDLTSTAHAAMATRFHMPPSTKPSRWIEIENEDSRAVRKAVFHLPDDYAETEENTLKTAEIAARRLGMQSPEITMQLSGSAPTLTLEASTMPDDVVRLKDVIDYIKNTGPDDNVLGLGRRSLPVEVGFHDDSPHWGASMGSGAGKSVLARFVAAQALYKGAIVMILDAKGNSHPWARGLPNVAYCDTKELMHEGLIWLGKERNRRAGVAKFTSDFDGNVSGNVGPRLLVIAEELNLMANMLRPYWRDELNGQGQSPALLALQDVAFAGRDIRMNIFFVGQMLTARVTGGVSGGGEARENIGVRMLGRYTKKAWQMLVPEFPMPPNSKEHGRIQVVASGELKETQVAYITGIQARELSQSGTVSALPPNIPGAPILPEWEQSQRVAINSVNSGHDQPETAEISNVATLPRSEISTRPVTITEACNQGILKGKPNSYRTWRRSDPNFPGTVPMPDGGNSLAHYHDPVELADYEAERARQAREARKKVRK